MSILLSIAAAAAPTLAACPWDRPGANPFMRDVVAAVDRYQDIPAATRRALKGRMAARKYDEIVTIGRDTIEGTHRYADLRDMHFGEGQICRTVTRDKWLPGTKERGLVYCEDGHCILVPTVCRNVSRVTRQVVTTAQGDAPASQGDAPVASAGPMVLTVPGAPGVDSSSFGPVVPGGGVAYPSYSLGLPPRGDRPSDTFVERLRQPSGSWFDSWGAPGVGRPGWSPSWQAITSFGLTTSALQLQQPQEPQEPQEPTESLTPQGRPWIDVDVSETVANIQRGGMATPTPEPRSWAMMVTGLLVILAMTHRRMGPRR